MMSRELTLVTKQKDTTENFTFVVDKDYGNHTLNIAVILKNLFTDTSQKPTLLMVYKGEATSGVCYALAVEQHGIIHIYKNIFANEYADEIKKSEIQKSEAKNEPNSSASVSEFVNQLVTTCI